MCGYYGQLNFIDVTIEKGKQLKNIEEGKITKRYTAICNALDPDHNFNLKCRGSIIFYGEEEIANIRTYKSDKESRAFSLDENAIQKLPSICVAFNSEENIEKIFLVPIGEKIKRGVSESSSISESVLFRFSVKADDYKGILESLMKGKSHNE